MELKLTLTLKSSPQAARSHLFPLQVNSHPAPPLSVIVIVVKGRLGHSLSVIKDTLVACGGWDLDIRTSCISWKKGHDGWEDFHTLRSNCVLSLQIHRTMMPSRRYCEVENKYYIIIAQKTYFFSANRGIITQRWSWTARRT